LTISTGAVQWFDISGYPAGLVRGSDGNPWFTEYTDRIGTIANNTVSEFGTQGAQPYPPILGSDGNVWCGDGGDGSVLTKRYVGNVTPQGVVNEYLTAGLPNGLIQAGSWIYFGENAAFIGRAFSLGDIVK
jgi:streptogramin lyase